MWLENARPAAETSRQRYLPVVFFGAPTVGADGKVADAKRRQTAPGGSLRPGPQT
jgi:hypothetical protein